MIIKSVSLLMRCSLLILFTASFAHAIKVDLNNFFADPSVVVSANGSNATLYEDPALSTVLLSNDPFLGYPGVFIPANSVSLTFNYNFFLAPSNTDEFYAYLFDPSTYTVLTDNSGNPLELWLNSTQNGTITWDLLGASFLGQTIGMEFQLNSLDLITGSYASINNVSVNPVPEPATAFLVGSGMLGAGIYRFVRRRIKQ